MRDRPVRRLAQPIRSSLVLVKLLVVAAVLALPVPALVLGARGLLRRSGYSSVDARDRTPFALLVTLRLFMLLLLLVLSALTLVAAVGAMIRDWELPSMVYVLGTLDLLVATLVVLTFGRRDRRPARRRATPAAR
jgi:uncharacterized Tic20 family protein